MMTTRKKLLVVEMGLVLSCVIFSTQFEVETADLNMGKLYKQSWTNNMSNVSKPKSPL